jgi:glucose-1-phosphate cytidylyltransferase
MQSYIGHGHNDFAILVGYKGEQIKRYFTDFRLLNSNVVIDSRNDFIPEYVGSNEIIDWRVEVIDTGQLTQTGGRLFNARDRLLGDSFFCTYGDGVSDVNISDLLSFHKSHGKIATVTVVQPMSRFGVMRRNPEGLVTEFLEKPQMEGIASAGFFVFEPEIFDYLGPNSTLEREPLASLAANNQLMSFQHNGFWEPMDTFRETQQLNEMWERGDRPWIVSKGN